MEIKQKRIKGFSLVEMLVAAGVFAIVAVVTTQSLATSLKNARKSDAIRRTRENVDYSISTMERLLRNAQDVTCTSPTRLTYEDEFGNSTFFECSGGNVASGSARLTSTSSTFDCSAEPVFVCTSASYGIPASVQITLNAYDTLFGRTEEGASVRSRTKVLLRNYLLY